MAECQEGNSIVIWDRIPGGSSLEIWAEGKCEDFVSTVVAKIVTSDGSQREEAWCEHADLCAGEADVGDECGTRSCLRRLEAGFSYDVRFRVTTNRATRVVKRARVCLDGTLLKRWRCTLDAPAGDVTECRIQILMADG